MNMDAMERDEMHMAHGPGEPRRHLELVDSTTEPTAEDLVAVAPHIGKRAIIGLVASDGELTPLGLAETANPSLDDGSVTVSAGLEVVPRRSPPQIPLDWLIGPDDLVRFVRQAAA